jgi:hypothetical protein
MMKKMTQLLVSMGLVSGLTFAVMPTPVSAAASCAGGDATACQKDCDNGNAAACMSVGAGKTAGSGTQTDLMGLIRNIINIILMVLGAVAVLMIVIGGIRYVTSNGEAAHVKSAKDTILYAVIGLIVAILAYAIVNFVITKLVG